MNGVMRIIYSLVGNYSVCLQKIWPCIVKVKSKHSIVFLSQTRLHSVECGICPIATCYSYVKHW